MAIHIGKKVKEELYRQGLSITSFAKRINRSRNVIYDIFERESIDTALLNKIGIVLRMDFFSLYSDQKEYKKEGIVPAVVRDEKAIYHPMGERLKLLEKQNEALHNEVAYLKKIVTLMEEEKGKKSKKGK